VQQRDYAFGLGTKPWHKQHQQALQNMLDPLQQHVETYHDISAMVVVLL
jgi:hypothetical protein